MQEHGSADRAASRDAADEAIVAGLLREVEVVYQVGQPVRVHKGHLHLPPRVARKHLLLVHAQHFGSPPVARNDAALAVVEERPNVGTVRIALPHPCLLDDCRLSLSPITFCRFSRRGRVPLRSFT